MQVFNLLCILDIFSVLFFLGHPVFAHIPISKFSFNMKSPNRDVATDTHHNLMYDNETVCLGWC